MSNITFLERRQIIGDDQLEIFKKYGVKCAITDFSILLGGLVSSSDYTSEGTKMSNRTGCYWTRNDDGAFDDALAIHTDGDKYYNAVRSRYVGGRPALPYSSIKSISSTGVRGSSGVLEVEYGEYPQTIITEPLEGTLEEIYKSKSLTKTGKKYTTDSQREGSECEFEPRTFEEYQ